MTQVTEILSALERGDPAAAERLLPLVYDELRRLAAAKLAQEKPGHTLQATALVHEAYLRLVGDGDRGWDGRGHFFAAAAEAMRRLLIESARRKNRIKHGGERKRVDLESLNVADPQADDSVLALSEALDRLAAEDEAIAHVVKLRYFAGLTIEETAASLGLSVRTANRHWAYAKAWLYRALNES